MVETANSGANIADLAISAIESDPVLAQWWAARNGSWGTFTPRPDKPEAFDQQHSFCYSRDPVSFLVGGNAAGTTEAAAFKTALFLLRQQPPPRKNTPFWIISNTYDQVCGTCWDEKLVGHGHIPECEVDWEGISWLDTKRGYPKAVPLKPWPDRPGRNWLLEFKSYEQGRTALQARSIGGFWFSEQFPMTLFLEVLRGCREYMFPGGQFAEFTPIDPELCLWIEQVMDNPPPGWAFYRANTECNKHNLADGWFEQFFSSVPDEMLQTRMTGALASFEGVIYQAFNPAIHVIADELFQFPLGAHHHRGVDWGASMEHPFACVWGYRDGVGDWWVYDEYWCPDQDKTTADHAAAILERWPWPSDDIHYGATFADPSRPGDINAFVREGIWTQSASNAVFKGIDCIRSLLKIRNGRPKIFISRRCKRLIEELRKYRWKRGRRPEDGNYLNPQVAAAAPLKRDDDLADALRYMIFSVENQTGAAPSSATRQRAWAARQAVPLHRGSENGSAAGNYRAHQVGGR